MKKFLIETLEIASNLFNLISVLLARKNSIHTWWTGIIGCILFGVLFFNSHLYADTILQIFFIGTSIVGWWSWNKRDKLLQELPITHVRPKNLVITAVIALVLTVTHGALLHYFTDASYPFIDSSI